MGFGRTRFDIVNSSGSPNSNSYPAYVEDGLHAGEDLTNDVEKVELQYTNFNISTASTTLVKTGAGYVDEIIFVGGTSGNITIYDNTTSSGTELCPTVQPQFGTPILKHCTFSVGLTVVTAAASVVTGSYR